MKKYNFITRKLLIKEYVSSKNSKAKLSIILNCAVSVITRKLIKYNLPIKDLSESHKGQIPWNKNIPMREETKRKLSKFHKGEIGYWRGKKRPNISKRMRGKNNPAARPEVRKKISLNHADVSGLKNPMYGNPRIDLQEKFKGKGNPNYLHGKAYEPYSSKWTETLKESIRQRDNYICQLCGRTQKREIKELNQKLSVHHIDYNKEHLNPNNLMTLCRKCNMKVNFNRDYWYAYFTYIIEETRRD